MDEYSLEDLEKTFPTIRLTKVVLSNFRNVEHGEITLCNGKLSDSSNIKSNILGIYGQNGSGKTAFIEALTILKSLMSGEEIDDEFSDCIAFGEKVATLEFTFNLYFSENKKEFQTTYSFCLMAQTNRNENKDKGMILNENVLNEGYHDIENIIDPGKKDKIIIFNEKFYIDENSSRKQIIIDTSSQTVPFVPDTKRKMLVGGKNQDQVLELAKNIARSNSKSFIFSEETLSVFEKNNKKCIYYLILYFLNMYACHYLFVLPTKSAGLIRLNKALPLHFRFGVIPFKLDEPIVIPEKVFKLVKNIIRNTSLVLEQLVPGLTIDIKQLSETLIKQDETSEKAFNVILIARRDNKELPLRDESDGVRRIISILNLLVFAFNNQVVTLAIDEFDAGVYEYLLGEILQIMEEFGKGQFIFTSHNLRPLEIINKKFICFTTTNPKNRYFRLKNVAATNNLRDTYFREILVREQKEEIYNPTKRFKIIAALKKASGELK